VFPFLQSKKENKLKRTKINIVNFEIEKRPNSKKRKKVKNKKIL